MINVELDFLCHKGINKIVLSSVWHHTRQRVEEAISGRRSSLLLSHLSSVNTSSIELYKIETTANCEVK